MVDRSALSPSGVYRLHVLASEGGRSQFFQITDDEGRLLFTSLDSYDTRHRTYFLWDAEDRVWVYSGDVGTFFWEADSETGEWEQYTYVEAEVEAPPFLQELRSRWHGEDPVLAPTSTPGPSSDRAALAERITLPYPPESVSWEVIRPGSEEGSRLPGSVDYQLVAVLRYDPDVARQLRAASVIRQSAVVVDEDFFLPWYPEQVREYFVEDAPTGYWRLTMPAYEVAVFARSPWLNGWVFFLETGLVFLFFHTS